MPLSRGRVHYHTMWSSGGEELLSCRLSKLCEFAAALDCIFQQHYVCLWLR